MKTTAHQSISGSPMAKTYTRIQRTEQNNPRTKYRKDVMSSEENNISAFFTAFSPFRYQSGETRRITTEEL